MFESEAGCDSGSVLGCLVRLCCVGFETWKKDNDYGCLYVFGWILLCDFWFLLCVFPPGFLVVFAGVFIKKESWPPRV